MSPQQPKQSPGHQYKNKEPETGTDIVTTAAAVTNDTSNTIVLGADGDEQQVTRRENLLDTTAVVKEEPNSPPPKPTSPGDDGAENVRGIQLHKRSTNGDTGPKVTEIDIVGGAETSRKGQVITDGGSSKTQRTVTGPNDEEMQEVAAVVTPTEEDEATVTGLQKGKTAPREKTDENNIKKIGTTTKKFKIAKKSNAATATAAMQQLRAISTPTRNETIMRENVTFNVTGVNSQDTTVNLSAIPVLSPPSPSR